MSNETKVVKTISILNHVLGPVMRGPSSSHTAGAFHIGSMARSMLGEVPQKADLAFDPSGSYAATYEPQGADRGFAMGLINRALTEELFFNSLREAPRFGLADLKFHVRPLAKADHPNSVEMELASKHGSNLRLSARSIGGGEVEITQIEGRSVLFNGTAFELLLEVPAEKLPEAKELLTLDDAMMNFSIEHNNTLRIHARRRARLPDVVSRKIQNLAPASNLWESTPVYFVQTGEPLYRSAAEMIEYAEQEGISLGEAALQYEAKLLGLSQNEVLAEMLRRYDIMVNAVNRGLDLEFKGMQLLPACAGSIFKAEAEGRLSVRSLHTRAAARAMAVMHVDGAMGVVCAAPTGGSAGVIPGTLVTLAEERGLNREKIGLALMAAGAIGGILAVRATFAAEVAGCQVEIGASGAMAAAAVIDAVGGSARQACDAAAISFQNTMGTVCDLLHGTVEIPCHTRNGSAAASAFVNADLILGGYTNYIPLDETIDAVYAVGLAMPSELRCTSKGGLAVTPSARALKPGCCGSGCSSCK